MATRVSVWIRSHQMNLLYFLPQSPLQIGAGAYLPVLSIVI